MNLALLRLVSPSLPIGAFSYSRGLEYAVEAGWVHDRATAAEWIAGVLRDAVAPVDGAVLVRMYAGWRDGDVAGVRRWSQFLYACRETAELQLEERAMGDALARLLRSLEVDVPMPDVAGGSFGYAAMFALACARWQVSLEDALAGYLWAFGESQVSAAVRLVPLGQTDGQRITSTLLDHIPAMVALALSLDDDELGGVAPAQAMASALHETQYTRLFRS